MFMSASSAPRGARTCFRNWKRIAAALQADLSKHVVLKYTPHLVFHLDDSIERGARVLEILQEIEPPPSAENE